MAEFDSDPIPAPDVTGIPVGASVVALNGTTLGTVREIHPHYLFVAEEGSPHFDLEVPVRAIVRFEAGRLHLRVNREALNRVDDTESARRLMGTE